MNILAVLRVIGVLLLGTSLAMVPSIILSVGEGNLGGWLVAAGVPTCGKRRAQGRLRHERPGRKPLA